MALSEVLDEIRESLKHDLKTQTWNKVEHNRYAPRDVAKTTLTRRAIQRLFQALSPESEKSNVAEEAAKAFDPATRVCRILATLIYFMNPGADELNEFRRRFVRELDREDGLLDENLPFDIDQAKLSFGRHGELFYNSQYHFCKPVLLVKDETVKYEAHRQWCRLPFSEREEIGYGSSCTVYRVKIDPYQYRHKEGPTSDVSIPWTVNTSQ